MSASPSASMTVPGPAERPWCLSIRSLGAAIGHLAEVRIDVDFPEDRIETDLVRLNRQVDRLLAASRPWSSVPELPDGLQARVREVDGETFVYIIDLPRSAIIATVTFNRLVELDRRSAGAYRSPHSRVAVGWRRQGIASAIYRHWLGGGRSLISGARQSPAARGLWFALARDYRLTYVLLDAGRMVALGDAPSARTLAKLNVRAVLLSRRCDESVGSTGAVPEAGR